ncbi:Sialoadhesin Sialic acid-binding Ig-like lectin 1 [Channa argus]|uniref:Sialoadhesin Sialic acid-binding Ig-like lectin 1 n=1 Tax=Channa argus TaxID=215402 RepID=A0A6G1QMY8_CHAAH|nr:Sialoadhesin Sialic acid-binding Ig-like lectin 1 [Channa argus]
MRSLTASPSVNMVTVNVLLSVFFTSGALAACPQDSHLFITAPQVMEALSGSCLLIPCNFRPESGDNVFDNTRQVFGVWIKGNPDENNVIFNSSGKFTKYPMSIIGNLSEKNCTTLFSNLTTNYRDTYYFRIMNWPYRATAVCDPLQINVTDSAPSPIIKIPGDLKEKESVTITCSALTPCPHSPPKLTWTLQQDPHTNIEENTDGTFTTKIQETITLSDRHDGLNISCSATYRVNGGRDVRTAETQETLKVSYAPKDTSASISPSGLVSAGTWVNLSCSSRARPPVSSFTWFKSSKDGARTVSEGAFYSFNATQGGVYYCVAANDLGNQTSALIQLIIGAGEASMWPVILGGIFGVMVLLCLIVCGWRLKSKHSAAEQTQHQTCEDLVSTKEKHEEEDIHYGEIHFSSLRAEASSGPVQDSGQQQDTVYAQVKVSERQAAAGSEQLYAEVKTK